MAVAISLSTQVIHSEKNPNNPENWLSITLIANNDIDAF
jgi:hypothetical protein